MMLRVVLSHAAERDLDDIYAYIAEHDSIQSADQLVGALLDVCQALAHFPGRGNRPKELARLVDEEIREAHLGPYRIVYEIESRRIAILCVADGRRDMQALLQRRLLG